MAVSKLYKLRQDIDDIYENENVDFIWFNQNQNNDELVLALKLLMKLTLPI